MPSRGFSAGPLRTVARPRAVRLGGAAVAGVALLLASACTGEGEPAAPTTVPGGVDRVIDVEMRDISFEPGALAVPVGSTVALRFQNDGRVVHEAFVGGPSGPGVELLPGAEGLLVHRFDEAGEVVIGCYEPGHFTAGMKIAVTVR